MKKLISALFLSAFAVASVSAQQGSWSNYNRYAPDNEALTQTPEVVFMGNSITDGWDDHHAEFFTDNNYACRGISGQVTSQMLCRFYQDVINLKPKAVVILAGTNDLAQNQGPIDEIHVVENIKGMTELAIANGIRPLIATCLPCDTIPWNHSIVNIAGKVVSLNEALRDYAAERGVTFVDYYTALTTPNGALNPEYTYDGVHPNRAGYDVMEPIVLAALNDKPCCKAAAKDCCKKAEAKPCCKDGEKKCEKNCGKKCDKNEAKACCKDAKKCEGKCDKAEAKTCCKKK